MSEEHREDRKEERKAEGWESSPYDRAFSIKNNAELKEAIADYRNMDDGDRQFYQAHLTFRLVSGLSTLNRRLRELEGVVSAVGGVAVIGNKRLAAIRKDLGELLEIAGEEVDDEPEEVDDDQPAGVQEILAVASQRAPTEIQAGDAAAGPS